MTGGRFSGGPLCQTVSGEQAWPPRHHINQHDMQTRTKNFLSGLLVLFGAFLILLAAARLGPAKTAGISVAAASGCAVVGWVIGSGIGVATAGVGMTAAAPLAVGLAAMCGYAGPAAAALGLIRPPGWAMPVFILGWCIVSGTIAVNVYRWRESKMAPQRSQGSGTAAK